MSYLKRLPYTYEQLEKAANGATCYSDIFRALNIKINGGSYVWLKKILSKHNIKVDFSQYKQCHNLIKGGHRATLKRLEDLYMTTDDISNGARMNAKRLRTFMLFKGREEKCEECGLTEWRGAKIRLDIHHIDGDCYNNHILNLQFICPNCHRQETIPYKESLSWTSSVTKEEFKFQKEKKRQKKEKLLNLCSDCGSLISLDAKRCSPCHSATKNKIEWPSDETLKELVDEFSLLSLGKKLGVSDNAIKKRCKLKNIVIPTFRRKSYLNDI
jgi:hypothetical protein